ncbi:DUF3757 domain-containing protein [Legionella longbeachae]|uniref:Uncharacterized protein n=1 Tax=Legionella longbeachae serogroup 1 (strain NSW150) TaxID=661367 RepID=D3HJ64_LEGLN|nr:DUF3757 domain-containing protein [Legionella longbeachae]VEE02953.1 Uncharacterised protein [Legionella oakridgensis]HBD7398846.1 DUF3757 domain-containing protein [Legionella pneumophila]ARB90811.1 DUF3757 domain-containing protein [Legionella longbeachae]ARM32763.1 DUF3757 domain-containing protein [Legionella longbeachae]EEZ94447.1 conserved hypothetical protein [Legionella longbeachae D-4968]
MNKYRFYILVYFLIQFSTAHSTICPDPKTTSLQWGVPPEPWVVNPVSPHRPQGDVNTSFVRANILVAGYGRGVVCTYRNSIGEYSIWWPTLTKIPSRLDYHWIETLAGFVCFQGLEQCQFYGAK